MRLRTLLLTLITLLASGVAIADAKRALPKIGELWFQDEAGAATYRAPFLQKLRDLGSIDGKSVALVPRFANGQISKLPVLLAELLRNKVDVMYVSPRAIPHVQQMKITIPVVSLYFDPIAEGASSSLARPSGNMTGVSWQTLESSGKRLQYVIECLPNAKHVALLYDPSDPGPVLEAKALLHAAKSVNLQISEHRFRSERELESALATITRQQAQAVIVSHSPLSVHLRSHIVRATAAARIPFVSEGRDFAEAGALLAFGPNLRNIYELAATYVHRIVQGAKPSALPIEQPTVFELVVNEKTARTLGIKIPESILIRADEVIR